MADQCLGTSSIALELPENTKMHIFLCVVLWGREMDLNPCCAPWSGWSSLSQACFKQVPLKVQKYFRAIVICVCCLFANAQRKDRCAPRQARAGSAGVLYSPETILLRDRSDSEPSPQLERPWDPRCCRAVEWPLMPTRLPGPRGMCPALLVSPATSTALMNAMGPKTICFGCISLGIGDITYSFDSTERR